MTDEEKKVIEYLKRHIIPCYGRKGTIEFMLNDIVLNLIEKQSKEIEELKDTRSIFNMGRRSYKNEIEDKIKAKIKEYENKIKKIRSKKVINEPEDTIIITRYAHYISVLQSLLEKE